ncbi:MAG TPA: uroporphyrinogen-III synthase [Candidatus Acidoferrales bacterium]|nr:uroporphyrinogen-III synthase [Candidatus Acidoferrales bacterium]
MDAPNNALNGKRIVLTRSSEQAGILLQQLKGRGAQVIALPFVEFRPPGDFAPLDSALSRLVEFDWIVFTSQNAVRFFCTRMRELSPATVNPAAFPRVAAIGDATAGAAAAEGLRVEFVASGVRSGREFVAEFSRNARARKILLPQSDQAGDDFAAGLRDGGAIVTPVVAYRTCMPESLDSEGLTRLRREGADVFLFASPSAFHNFARAVGRSELNRFARDSIFAAIGPTTAQAIRKAGVPVGIEAAKPSSDEIVKAMIAHFSKPKQAKARP